MEQQLLDKINILEEENEKLKIELHETKEHLKKYTSPDIVTGCKNVPTIWYNDKSDKKRKHFVDIYIPTQNKCIEVKSTWTIKDTKANIFHKQTAAKELGYNYEIWVYDRKGNKVETFI